MRKDYLKRGALDAARGGNAIGKFSVKFTSKELDILELRKFSLYIMNTLSWVEDAALVIIDRIALEPGEIAVYFLSQFPDDFAVDDRQNQTREERRTLLFRLRFLLHCLYSLKSEYKLFEQWRFSGLEFVLDSFEDKIHQALGERTYYAFSPFYARLKRLWKAVSPELDSPEAVGKELSSLSEDIYGVFETLYRECARREADIQAKRLIAEQASMKEASTAEAVKQRLAPAFDDLGRKLIECHDSIGAKLDDAASRIARSMDETDQMIEAVAKALAKLGAGKNKNGRKALNEKIADICLILWDTAGGIGEIRFSHNKKITYGAVFNFHRTRLAKIGVHSNEESKAILRNAQRRRNRCIDAKGSSTKAKGGDAAVMPHGGEQKATGSA